MPPQKFTISYIGQSHSGDILAQILPTDLRTHYSSLNQTYSQFQVAVDSHHWIVLKNHHQIINFVEYLQKHYQQPQSRQKLSRASNKHVIKLEILVKNASIDIHDQRVIQFFEIYDLQFNKVKSLTLKKKSGGRYVEKLCCQCSWRHRAFVITQNGILYHKKKDGQKRICQYISFNKYFQLDCGITTGSHFGIVIKSYHRKLKLYAENMENFVLAVYYLKKAWNEFNQEKNQNLYGAFSAPKDNNSIEFLVDGEQYFGAVARAIYKAKHQVMIAGWWISPEFYLVRPVDPKNPQKNRLSTILKDIIKQNDVKIYILAYRQSAMFLPNDSKYTKKALQSISSNIKVITHPINVIPSLWSHHQKIVIVDQKVAFIGGLDMCYGRFDTSQHSIRDKENLYPGIEFNNSRIRDFEKVRQYELSNIMRSKHPRLPWHDVSLRMVGGSVGDVVRHFVEYWNFASYEALYQERIVLVPESTKIKTKIKNIVAEIKNKIWLDRQPNSGSQEDRNYPKTVKSAKSPKVKTAENSLKNLISEEMQDQPPKKHFQDIINHQYIKFQSGQQLAEDQKGQKKKNYYSHNNMDRQYPSKNQGKFKIQNKQSVRQKSAQKNITNRIFSSNSQNQYYDSDNGEYLNERSYDFQDQHQGVIRLGQSKNRWSWVTPKVSNRGRKSHSKGKRTRKMSEKSIVDDSIVLKVDKCQVLRSVSKWSIGCNQTQSEASIHSAYVDIIKNAQHFIYIQNQFFMSAVQGENVLKNQVALALIQRITRAISEKKKFRVMIFMPLIPGFAGELDNPDAVLPRVIMHWQFLTIFNGENSLIKSIARLTPDPSKYIQFYGLRTHDILKDGPVTQIVYLHTKLMITDDTRAIIGSANINDRSMRGTRDSEIAVMLSRGMQADSVINGRECKVNLKIRDLRLKLMQQHFGKFDSQGRYIDFRDPLDSGVYQRLEKIAEQNTEVYRKLFGCYPDNEIETLRDLRRGQRKPTRDQYFEARSSIRGHVVHFPYRFLSGENLLEGNSIYPNAITT